MIHYKDKSFCSRSYSNGGDCIENCWRLLTVEERKKAEEMGLGIAFSDFRGTSYCIITLEEDDGK